MARSPRKSQDAGAGSLPREGLDTAREGVLLTSPEGAITFANQALLDQLDADAAALEGRDIGAVLLPHGDVYDPLTGLPREALIEEQAAPLVALARRKGRPLALARVAVELADGPAPMDPALAGAALRELTARLRAVTRDTDLLARTSDGAFLLVLQEVPADESLGRAAARILDRMREPIALGGTRLSVVARLGAALFPRDASGWIELVGRADAALGMAVAAGEEFAFFEEGLTSRSRDRLRMEADFAIASDASELQLHYQPVVATQSRRMVGAEALARGHVQGVEALARWPHRKRGLVPPSEFIPVAEATGRILTLDRWALATAVRQASGWWDRGWDGWISVNLSTRSVRDPELADYVKGLLQERDVQPDRLILEITESAAMRDPETTIDILHALKDVGVRLAIDDFGSGHSSLAYLRRLPVDFIKLDRGFLQNLGSTERDRWVVESIVGLAHRIGAEVVAEGVERQEDLEWLRDVGCDLVQGFLIGRPAPAEEATPTAAGGG